jgi:hypothetical protein
VKSNSHRRKRQRLRPPDSPADSDTIGIAVKCVKESFIGQILKQQQIFDNPIIYDILRFVSLLDKAIVLPSFDKLQKLLTDPFTKLVNRLAEDESDALLNLFPGMFNQASKIIAGQGPC